MWTFLKLLPDKGFVCIPCFTHYTASHDEEQVSLVFLFPEVVIRLQIRVQEPVPLDVHLTNSFCVLKITDEFYRWQALNPRNDVSSLTETTEVAGASKIFLAH
jgi:hypothetical protein